MTMEAITDLPMLDDIDADYSPQYVKLARIIRGKIESGQYKRGDPIPAPILVHEYRVSMQVAWHALVVLAANRYLARPMSSKPYHVIWDVTPGEGRWAGAGGACEILRSERASWLMEALDVSDPEQPITGPQVHLALHFQATTRRISREPQSDDQSLLVPSGG
jgi:hypothetical protein